MEQDRFEKQRTAITGLPGFLHKTSTMRADALALIPQSDYIIETVRCNEGWTIFIQGISAEGATRAVIPDKVVRTLWRHYEGLKLKNVQKHILKKRQKAQRKARKLSALKQAESILVSESQ